MASAARQIPSPLHALRARKAEAEKALRAARVRNLRARTALAAATGAAAVARRMVVELTQRELQRALAEVTAAAEALDAADSRQILLAAVEHAAAPRRGEGSLAEGAAPSDAAEPLLAWARAHAVGTC